MRLTCIGDLRSHPPPAARYFRQVEQEVRFPRQKGKLRPEMPSTRRFARCSWWTDQAFKVSLTSQHTDTHRTGTLLQKHSNTQTRTAAPIPHVLLLYLEQSASLRFLLSKPDLPCICSERTRHRHHADLAILWHLHVPCLSSRTLLVFSQKTTCLPHFPSNQNVSRLVC